MIKVLAVDDEPAILQVYITFLKLKGYEGLKAFNGKEALNIIKTKYPDAIITDLSMPVMDGVELIKQIRSNPKFDEVPIIVITGTPEMLSQDNYKNLVVFTKPVPFKLVINKLGELIN